MESTGRIMVMRAQFDGIVGSYTNVIGLPVETTRRLLEGFGVVVSERSGP